MSLSSRPIHSVVRRAARARNGGIFLWCLLSVTCAPALAALPTTQNSSSGSSSTNYIEKLKGYVLDGAVLLGLVICVFGFFSVANAIITSFNEVREGRLPWSKFGGLCVVGIVLLIVIIWLLNLAANILA